MTQVLVEEEDQQQQQQQQELVEMELSEAVAAAGGSQVDPPQSAPVPEQTYDSLFPALPMGSTKPGRPVAAVNNNAPMVKVTSSRITQVII